MKKTSIFPLLILFAVMTLMVSGCTKDTVILHARFERFHANNGQKLYVDENTPKWKNGDTVFVNDAYSTISLDGSQATLMAETSTEGYVAIFTGGGEVGCPVTNTGGVYTFNVPQTQKYEVVGEEQQIRAPMYASSFNSTLEFKNLGAVMKITLENKTGVETTHRELIVDTVIVEASHLTLWGTATVNVAETTYTCNNNSQGKGIIYLDITNSSTNVTLGYTEGANTHDVYVCVPPTSTENHYTITVCAHQPNGTIVHYKKQQSETPTLNGAIGRNKMANITFDISETNLDEIIYRNLEGIVQNALFSVGANQQVYFSQGNLQWRNVGTHAVQGDNATAAGEWRFAEHQWDYVGDATNGNVYYELDETNTKCNNASVGVSGYTGWIDLFGWATSGYLIPPNTWYTNESYYYSPSVSNVNLSGDYSDRDWGYYNAISNGGNEPGKWRTLTSAEWDYLLNTRTSVDGYAGKNHSYKYVTFNGIQGLLLFKDGYGSTASITSTITGESLPSGCVFLPYAGFRNGTTITDAGSVGKYWSATYSMRSLSKAYHISNDPITVSSDSPHLGYSVRLVMDKPTN